MRCARHHLGLPLLDARLQLRRDATELIPGHFAIGVIIGGELEPQTPETAAHSIAIGAPGDGNLVIDAVRTRGGWAATASDPEIFEAIDLLGRTEGILTEPAGGTTIACTARLAQEGKIGRDEVVVAAITGNGMKETISIARA